MVRSSLPVVIEERRATRTGQTVPDLAFCVLANGACVEKHHVRFAVVLGVLVARRVENRIDDLCVAKVHLAAVRLDENFSEGGGEMGEGRAMRE